MAARQDAIAVLRSISKMDIEDGIDSDALIIDGIRYPIGAVAEGDFLKRSGLNIIGASAGGTEAENFTVRDTLTVTFTPTVLPTVTLTVATQPTPGDTMVFQISGVFTFRALGTGSVPEDIEIGANLTDTKNNIIERLTNHNVISSYFSTGSFIGNDLLLTERANTGISTTSNFTSSNNYFSAVSFTGGADAKGLLFVGNGNWDSRTSTLDLSNVENDSAEITVTGVGAQITLSAADGDEDHVGGEVHIISGGSQGQNGGELTIQSGGDTGGGDAGSINILSGSARTEDENGGDGGDINIKASAADGSPSDGDGGNINIQAGTSRSGHGGHLHMQAGATIAGTYGQAYMYEGSFSYGIELHPVNGVTLIGDKMAFFSGAAVSQPVIPAIPTIQNVVDALLAINLASQAA